MKPEWLLAESEHFKTFSRNLPEASEFFVPIFYNLNISSTGMNYETVSELEKIIRNNGGVYHGCFCESTNIILAEREHKISEKIKAAILNRKIVLTPDWVYESLENGYTLPIKTYKLNLEKNIIYIDAH